MLPKEFLERMERMLGDEYPAFLKSYDRTKYKALRVNALKSSQRLFPETAPFPLKQVPWAENGYYYGEEDQPGKHPYHEAGVYYIQEPSAMAPAEYLLGKYDTEKENQENPAWRILDLCAAPGGKSTQIAEAMRGRGILVCNEIHPVRAKVLSENVERMGIRNAIVTNETPRNLSWAFSGYFTHILVDAPCSGEGMFRKNEDAVLEWSPSNVKLCGERQDEILDYAAWMLAPGGRLVYSTCTFAPAENEGSVSRFLKRHPEFDIVDVKKAEGMEGGVAAWIDEAAPGIEKTIRLWPHKLPGEGHYFAVLKKSGQLDFKNPGVCRGGLEKGIPEQNLMTAQKGCMEFLEFVKESLRMKVQGTYLKFGDQLYLVPNGTPSLQKLRVLRPGLHLGTVKKNRFEPSHALALALHPEDAVHTVDLHSDGTKIRGYLNGQTFPCEGQKGWYLITVDGYSAGWGKLAGGVMKNHYPKGLRRNL